MSAPPPPQSPFDGLPRNIATTAILSHLTSNDWLHFSLASRNCFDIVHGCPISQLADYLCGTNTTRAGGSEESESLWRLALVRDYLFDTTNDEHLMHQSIEMSNTQTEAFLSTGDLFTASNSYTSWKHWRKLDIRFHQHSNQGRNIPPSERLVGPFFLRAGILWRKIEEWCNDENRSGIFGQELKSSLVPGRALNLNQRGIQTSALKAVYAYYSGQTNPMTEIPATPRGFNPFIGLFGGYQVYEIISSLSWLEPEFVKEDRYLVIAQGERSKTTVVDLHSGQVYLIADGNQKLLATPTMGEPHRTTIGSNVQEDVKASLDSKDSILRWFEEHAKCLHKNLYSVGNIIANVPGGRPAWIGQKMHSILRYPTIADTAHCSRAVTRGVEVVASSLCVPEMGMFVYSIRMRLLAQGEDGYMTPAQRGFHCCQLISRHWRVGKFVPDLSEPQIENVRGEGVVGFYPSLFEGRYINYEGSYQGGGGREAGEGTGFFSYQSCTSADTPGFVEGSLQFMPVGLATSLGDDLFDVQVARFPLKIPQYLY